MEKIKTISEVNAMLDNQLNDLNVKEEYLTNGIAELQRQLAYVNKCKKVLSKIDREE